MIKMVQNCKNQ